MTISGYKKAIAKLLKAYHKKWDCFGKERKMDLKNHKPNYWLLFLIVCWLLMIFTIMMYV